LSTLTSLYSAETYVKEPGDLWATGLPKRFREKAFRLEPVAYKRGRLLDAEEHAWVQWDGQPLAALEDTKRQSVAGTASAGILAMMDREGIGGAVLYPSIASQAFSACPDSKLLDAFLEVYNRWIIGIASPASERLKPAALVNVDEPTATVRTMRRLAKRGAAGFVLPIAPGEGYRYDQPRYEMLWRAADELDRPLMLLAGTHRLIKAETAEEEATRGATLAARLAFKATAVFPARRSITAIIYAGVFERYPSLRIGVVGYGAAWAAYAMVRADEMYEVRPERTGPPIRVTRESDQDRAVRHLEHEAGVAIASEDRSGTRGMAPEGVGYHFPPGESFSDHFRRNVFLTFGRDSLGLSMRGFIGVDGMLWGHRLGEFHVANKSVMERLDILLDQIPSRDRELLVSANTARIYRFGSVPGRIGIGSPATEPS
jgi:predicted TIM-barrel fold metal-dependent hydrolase